MVLRCRSVRIVCDMVTVDVEESIIDFELFVVCYPGRATVITVTWSGTYYLCQTS